jgi:uncharacterized protein (DUF608 family)
MPFVNFPNNPSIGDSIFIGTYQYTWTGSTWDRVVVNVQNIIDSIEGVAIDKSFTILSADTWTDQTGFFTLAKTVSGVVASDNPIIDLNLSGATLENIPDIQTAWGAVYRATTTTDTITLYALEAPVFPEDTPIKVKVVR